MYGVCPNLREMECLPIAPGSVGWTMLSSVSRSEAQADGGSTFRSCLGDCGGEEMAGMTRATSAWAWK